MTDAEKKKFEETMAARLKANRQPAETPAEAAEREKLLKALAAKHGQDTLKATGTSRRPRFRLRGCRFGRKRVAAGFDVR